MSASRTVVIPTLTEWPVLALYCVADVGQSALGVLGRHIDQRAEELVASVADHEVIRANPLADGRDDLDEDAVACRVPVGVVDMLEAVDVEEDHRDPLAADAA